MTVNQHTIVTLADNSGVRLTEMPFNPATIKKQLAAVWNIPHQIIIDLEMDITLSDPLITAKLPVASWQQCPQSRVEGRIAMGSTVAYVSLRYSALAGQEEFNRRYYHS